MQSNWESGSSFTPQVYWNSLIHLHIFNKHNKVINVIFSEVKASQEEVSSKMYL